jgi:Mitochondrial carrier protein
MLLFTIVRVSNVPLHVVQLFLTLYATLFWGSTCFQHAPPVSGYGALVGTIRHTSTANTWLRMEQSNELNFGLRDEDESSASSSILTIPNAHQQIPFEKFDETPKNRRLFFSSTLLAAAALVSVGENTVHASSIPTSSSSSSLSLTDSVSSLPWQVNPVNKRSGVTVFDAEKAGYNVAFVTYLARFLLNFDPNCQILWFSAKFPTGADAKEVERLRLEQFASFSASVEVGLQDFEGPNGPSILLNDLVKRYGSLPPSVSSSTIGSFGDGSIGGVSDDGGFKNKRRLAQAARRHIALLFGLLDKMQPTQDLTKLLASVDDGHVTSVQLLNETFCGYDLGKEPVVMFPPPEAGEEYKSAEGRAVLMSTGKVLRFDVVDPGMGYSKAPVVTVEPPESGGSPAKAQAKIYTKGPEKGSIESIQLVDAGAGYADGENIVVTVEHPEEGRKAVLLAILDMAVDRIEITQQGSGYAVEQPLNVYLVQPPLLDSTARPGFFKGKIEKQRLAGQAFPSGESSSFTGFRRESDRKEILELEEKLETKYNLKSISGMSSGDGLDSGVPPLPFWSGKSTSSELLRLLPAGVGLEYDEIAKHYTIAVDADFMTKYPAAALQQSSNRPISPDFGPRGRSPIERKMQLGWSEYLPLTPLDVVKTKVQTNPVKYPSIASSFRTVYSEEGIRTFFTGWLPTVLGNLATGGVLYACTEYIRRTLSEAAGVDAVALEAPIILVAAGIASAFGAVLVSPFEAVRIRTVAQPDFAENAGAALSKMVKEEGVGSLVNAIPIFLIRNVPYAMT